MQAIEEKYNRPEHFENLCIHRVNKEIWTALRSQVHTQDSKLQGIENFLLRELFS